MLNSAICDVGDARLLRLTIHPNPLIWYDRLAKREVFCFFFEFSLHGCCERLASFYRWRMGGTKTVIVDWEKGTRAAYAIIVRIDLEMCINFAQVYLRNG